MNIRLLTLCAVIALAGSETAMAQAEVSPLASVIGMPFSGVRTNQGAKNFVDGNRIDRGTSEHLYRDGQGRTRVERELPAPMLANNPQMEPVQITINDPVSGDRIELHARTKTAIIVHGAASAAVPARTQAPKIFVMFARHLYGADDPGWSKPVSLGERSFDGLRAQGQRAEHPIPIGTLGNEKPITLTVEQWFSPELSLIVAKSGKSTLGGEFSNQIENIVRGEPDPALFQVPSDYQRIDVPRAQRQAAAH